MWVRRGCGLIVAGVAAYASYQHQRGYALTGGADGISAALWPLSVDGLLLLATAGVMKLGRDTPRRARFFTLLAFWLGIAVSLAANVAAAPVLTLHTDVRITITITPLPRLLRAGDHVMHLCGGHLGAVIG
jgi:hypothetical protein